MDSSLPGSSVHRFSRQEYWNPLGSSVHRILQVRILEWVAIPYPRDLLNLGVLHCGQTPYHLSHQGNPRYATEKFYLEKFDRRTCFGQSIMVVYNDINHPVGQVVCLLIIFEA